MTTTSKRIEFTSASGERLAGRIDLPVTPPIAYAIFAHCFTCGKDSKAATFVSQALTDAGIAVLRFDFAGLGGSEGDFSATNFSSNIDDLVRAADCLRERYRAPALLLGHSLGGTASLLAAARIPEVRAIATIGAPSDPAHVAHLLRGGIDAIDRDGEAEVDIGGRPFRVRKQFLEDIRKRDLAAELPRLRKALLILHSPRDTIVSVDNAASLFTAARHPKSFISLDPADHLLSRRADGLYAGQVIAAWAVRHIDAAALPAPMPVEGKVVVRETREGTFTNHVVAGRHVLRADEPESVGGLDSGPSPYDYLAAALGACTTMTLRLYADRKGLPLERVTVEVKHEKIHATECAECETREGRIDRLDRRIRLEGELDPAARSRLLEIADKCPVHRTLHGEIQVTTRLADPSGGE